jgi:peptide/nickel transport system substrate-binding protein
MSRRRVWRSTLSLGFAVGFAACTGRGGGPGGALTVSDGRYQAAWTRNFNPFLSDSRWPTRSGIYEPLLIFNTIKGTYETWLSTGFRWSDANRRLAFAIRPGVKWSDGQPFTARDVAFTFELMKRYPTLDSRSVWTFLEGVAAPDDATVDFTFKHAYTPGLVYIGHQPIVPAHRWKDVSDPVNYANEQPVATGPFTVIREFRPEMYELGRNDTYWQPGKPQIAALRLPALADNDAARQALLAGRLDWAGLFIPDIDGTFVAKDREHNRYWFPPVGNPVLLYLNTTRKPFSDPNVRKALSMALDRGEIVKVAMLGYATPADATGISDADARWKDPAAVKAGYWVERNLARANALLDGAHLPRGTDGTRRLSDGASMKYVVDVVKGWSDWVTAVEVISRNLKDVGVETTAQSSEFSDWYERVSRGNFDVSIGWGRRGPTPYHFYRSQMSSETLKPVGEPAFENWHRFASKEVDGVLGQFEGTDDPSERKTLNNRLQWLFVEQAPSLPLFPGPSWGEYSSARFTGFPDEKNPFARLAPFQDEPDPLLVLVALQPR